MAAEKKAFELKANFNSMEVAVDTRLIRIEEGDTYETKDPDEIRELENHPAVKAADTPAPKSSKGKEG